MTTTALIGLAAKASLALLVLAVGLTARPHDATYLLRHRSLLLRSLLSMHVVMPLAALWVTSMFFLDPAVKIALIALSVSPMPPLLPGKALRAGGDRGYVIGLLTVVSLLSFIVIPLSLNLIGALFDHQLEAPLGKIEKTLIPGIVAPLLVGMLVNRVMPHAAERAARILSSIGVLVLIAAVLPILFTMWPAIRTLLGNGTLVAIITLTLFGLFVGHMLGGPRRQDREVLAVASCARHPAIAIAIASINFPDAPALTPAALLVVLVAGVTSFPYIRWMRHTIVTTPVSRYSRPERRRV